MFDIMGKKMPVFILPQDSIYRLGLCVDLFLVRDAICGQTSKAVYSK